MKNLPFTKKPLIISLIILAVTGILCLAYVASGSSIRMFSKPMVADFEVPLSNNTEIYQKVNIPSGADRLYGFKLWVTAHNRVDFGTYTVSLYEDSQPVYSVTEKSQFLRSDQDTTFVLDEPLQLKPGSEYVISIKDNYADGDDGISIWYSEGVMYCRLITMPSSSGFARLTIAAVFFISVFIMVLMGLTFVSASGRFDERTFLIFDICAVGLLCLGAFLFQYPDGPTITSWGKFVLDTIRTGRFRDYMKYAYDYGMSSGLDQRVYQFSKPNYNILVNILTAILLLPMWIVDQIFKAGWGMKLYDDFRKIYLIIGVIMTARYIRKTAGILGYGEHVGRTAGLLYMLSPVIIWGNLGLGQIDILVVLLITVAVCYIAQGRFEIAFFWLSASVTIKQFALFFVVAPLLCLIIGSLDFRRICKCLGMYIILPVVSAVVSRVLVPDYAGLASIYEDEWNHIARFFDFTMAYTSYFLLAFMLICFLCLCKGMRKDVRPIDYLLGPVAICVAFQLFSELNQQWTIYVLIAIVLASIFMERRYEFIVIMIVMALGYYLYVSGTPHNGDDDMITTGVLGHFFKLYDNSYVFADLIKRIVPGYSVYIHSVGATMLSASAVAAFYELIRARREGAVIDREYYTHDTWIGVGAMIISAISLGAILLSVLLYFGLIIP